MQRVVGRRVVEVSADELAAVRAAYPRLLLDVGTGDGKHAYKVARESPDTLVIGLDASPDALRETSAKAAARPAKGGVANVLYVWATAERPPPEIRGVTSLHVLMPWGSLLRGLLQDDGEVRVRLAETCAPGAAFTVLLNLHAWRPPVAEVEGLAEPGPDIAGTALGESLRRDGWAVENARYLEDDEVRGLTTSWGRRLRSSKSRFDVLLIEGTIG